MQTRITSRELDQAIRPGLENLRKYFTEADEAEREKAEVFLKGVRVSGQRMGAENNELAMLLKFGKLSGATTEEMRPVFRSIAAHYASGDVPQKTPEALAAPQSAQNTEGPK